MSQARIEAGLDALVTVTQATKRLAPQVAAVAERYAEVLQRGGTLYFCGNGGSAADAQHLATEYVVRYRGDRRPFAAVALTTDTSLLTAAANDLGFTHVFARQIDALCSADDLLIVHSTSGRSPNLLEAVQAARRRRVPVIAWLGKGGGELAALTDEAVIVPSDDTSLIQAMHLALQHLVVELVEDLLREAP